MRISLLLSFINASTASKSSNAFINNAKVNSFTLHVSLTSFLKALALAVFSLLIIADLLLFFSASWPDR